ncbi:TPA: superantigen-like protein SSL10 [Staphylococcus aureus]
MKFTTIAKAALALGILTTGVITTEINQVYANQKQKKVNVHDKEALYRYYSGGTIELTNVTAQRHENSKYSFLRLIENKQKIQVYLAGNDKNKYKEPKNHGLDIFAVIEKKGKYNTLFSVGGVTKTNKKTGNAFVNSPNLKIKNQSEKGSFEKEYPYSIQKEEISLKELDFKLRKHLIESYGLYKTTSKNGSIRIHMKDGGYYTFDLKYKLSFKRMGDVIDGTKIKNIEVNLK